MGSTTQKKNKPAPFRIDLEDVIEDEYLQQRAKLSEVTIAEYTEMLQADKEFDFPPVTVYCDPSDATWLVNGFHRLHAYRNAERRNMPVKIIKGTKREAWLYSLSANAKNGLRRTNADKHKAVYSALEDEELWGWTDTRIAELCGVSSSFVGEVRLKVAEDHGRKSPTEREGKGKGGGTQKVKVGNQGRPKAATSAGSVPEQNNGESSQIVVKLNSSHLQLIDKMSEGFTSLSAYIITNDAARQRLAVLRKLFDRLVKPFDKAKPATGTTGKDEEESE